MIKKLLFSILVSSTFLFGFSQSTPTAQPTDLQFLGIKAYGLSIAFTGSGAAKYLVLRSTSPITGVPVDGTSYVVGEWVGDGKVMANAANSFYTFRESVANTEYFFKIFAYNGSGSNTKYLTANPLSGSGFTTGRNIGNYYKNYRIDTQNSISDMTSLLKNHTDLLYGDFRDVVENIIEKDTAILVSGNMESKKYIVGEYSKIIHVYDNSINFSDYNREHVLARSWMPSSPNSNNDLQDETTDRHNLYLVKASVNQTLRSNYPFDMVDNSGTAENDCKNGKNSSNKMAFQPTADIKGNIARTLFYTVVTYNGVSGSWAFNNLPTDGKQQDVDVLVAWHNEDPVDNFEIARNEYIYSIQNNRNPFIDFPEWVACIDFKTLTLSGNCPLDTADVPSAIKSLFQSNDVVTYPNPAKEKAFVNLQNAETINSLELLNLSGQKVEFDYTLNGNIADLQLANVNNGMYILKINAANKVYTSKFMVLK